jgi:protein required for attachment to host cells
MTERGQTLPGGTLIVVTDSEKALFLVNLTDAEDPNFAVLDKDLRPNPKDSEQKSGPPGGHEDTGLKQRSSFEETDFHDLQKERFAKDLADKLYHMAHDKVFEKVVLVASPQVLGVLRDHLHKEVTDKMLGEIGKTLTGNPRHEIEEIVRREMTQMKGAA